jgi:hypothetical protein
MTSALTLRPLDPTKPITAVEDLQTHLYHAAQLELSTIPLYLYAAYSIQTQSYSQWAPGISAFRTIRSVVIEEMLHLCLVRNLMIAVGGGDQLPFYKAEFVPTYPSPMLHRIPRLMLDLERASGSLMRNIFMPLELPAKTGAPPEPGEYATIGQFYAAIKLGFETLAGPALWAGNRPELQYQSTYWNPDGGGSPILVCDLPSALAAIDTIVEQGEGSSAGQDTVPLDPTKPEAGMNELSHYAKFQQIADRIDGIDCVWPVPTSPTVASYAGTEAAALAELFNAAYSYVLAMIDALYAASRTTVQANARSLRYGLERTFIAGMNGLLYPIAALLVTLALPDGQHAAPTFEFRPFQDPSNKKPELARMCKDLLDAFPILGGDDGVQHLISLLPAV